jgi:NAD(P)H dehydrogenase (quinone)
MKDILILYYSKNDSTKRMARAISRGVESVTNVTAVIRTVNSKHYEEKDDLLVSKEDLKNCSGMIIGSPTHFGNMAAPLKEFFDNTTEEWLNHTLESKLGGVFTSTSSMHGGQETTLLSMMLPLLHHGMLIAGVPYSVKELSSTQSGGTPYGPSHVAHNQNSELTSEEKEICISYGKRFAQIISKMNI